MSSLSVRVAVVFMSWLLLSSFRMTAADQPSEPLLYDVRGAFVTARSDVSPGLIARTDRLVDTAIRSTIRQKALPRTILTVRISEAGYLPLVVGARFRAKVMIEATAVGNGEKIAVGSFTVSTFALDSAHADARLADRIAERIALEFRLQKTGPSTLATALFP
ncbi:hypothetical protein ACQKGC_07430 [Allorhizobium pseudoryzae]|jgi:hypothetical protein|uniref:hypothetical protein n=1 Tax=Allorhizobium pseudoryzae TaxID=379684 RepID=UPI0013ECF586|nr:hypothetical protein [Allorhizobium pseudoryzae]